MPEHIEFKPLTHGENTPFTHDSLKRGVAVASLAAMAIKKNPTSDPTAITHEVLATHYPHLDIEIAGERGVMQRRTNPALTLYVDAARAASSVAIGAVRPGEKIPEWGVMATSSPAEQGVTTWSVGRKQTARSYDPDSGLRLIPLAHRLKAPERGGTILLSSSIPEGHPFSDELTDAGYSVARYRSHVVAAQRLMDRRAPQGSRTSRPIETPVVGVAMHNASIGVMTTIAAFAGDRGHYMAVGETSDTSEVGHNVLLALSPAIGQTMFKALGGNLIHV